MMISSSPVTKTVEAAACTIDASEIEMTTALLLGATTTGATENTVTTDSGINAIRLGYGSTMKISLLLANEVIKVTSVTSATVFEATRGINGNAATMTDNSVISEVYAAIADNGVACTTNVNTDQTITVNSANAQTVEVFQLLRTPVPAGVSGTGVVTTAAVSNVASATDTAWTLANVTDIDVGDVGTVVCSTPAGRVEQVKLTTDNTTASVTRAVNGTTACETIVDTTDSNWYPWHDAAAGAVGQTGTSLQLMLWLVKTLTLSVS
jgi:hypothetical protein